MQQDSDKPEDELDAMIGRLAAEAPQAGMHGEGEGQLELSPALSSLSPERRPDPMPVCGMCPKSMWFAGKEAGLKAYCRAMHVVVWESENPQPILVCDGALEEEG